MSYDFPYTTPFKITDPPSAAALKSLTAAEKEGGRGSGGPFFPQAADSTANAINIEING
jgi:hypothetical protein